MSEQYPNEHREISVDLLVPNENNPNKMSKRAFNLLVDNLAQVGFTDPILVRPLDNGKFRIVGGHHRLEAALTLGYTVVPCTIITNPEFDDDMEAFQLMRHNMIKGSLDPESFVKLYEKVQEKYSNDQLADAFGFEDQAMLDKMVKAAARDLPTEMKAQFKEAAKEVKTIKDLSQLLNRLFTTYGDTLPYGFMFMDFGGKESLWIRMFQKDLNNMPEVYAVLKQQRKTLDGVLRGFLQSIAKGENLDVQSIIDNCPEVDLTGKEGANPTEMDLGMLNVNPS